MAAAVTAGARLDDDIDSGGTDGLRATALVVAVLFAVYAVQNALVFPPGARGPAVVYDLALVACGAMLYAVCRRVRLSRQSVDGVSAAMAFAVLGNILLSALLGTNPAFSFFVAVLLIASAGSVVSATWAVVMAVVEIGSWALVASHVLHRSEAVSNTLFLLSGAAVGYTVHATRRRARARIVALRERDAGREVVLQQTLAEADEVRRGLDRTVEDRTTALRTELNERERLEEQLRNAQKLEAVGRLAGGIAHDFNNLLTVIRMSLVTVGEPGVPPADVAEALRDASDATDRAAGLTHDLLAFARKQTLERTTVEVADILGGVERMIRRVAEASIRIEVSIAPELGEIVADRHQIEQVLLNLAINACDAMGNRGTLSLAAGAVELAAPEAARHRVRPGSYVCVAVRDTGTGMDEATKRAAFEPFFTTKEVGRGTGLGLAVAHGIVTQHGGQIAVESELGRGSTFSVFLPRARGTSPRTTVPLARPLAAPSRETLLVVEDEDAVRRAVQKNLERLGYHVLVARDGEDALRIAKSRDRIDLLLSDVVMPGIDGPELACQLRARARWTELPVLFVTGYSADRLARSGAIGPHDRVLEKPYQLEELARMIRHMLEARVVRQTTRVP